MTKHEKVIEALKAVNQAIANTIFGDDEFDWLKNDELVMKQHWLLGVIEQLESGEIKVVETPA